MAIKTILVEDSPKIRASLIPAMEELAGIEVIALAETQSEAADAMRMHAGQWQLAVIDIALQQGTGLGVLRECKDRASSQYAVVLTNYPTAEIRRRALQLGADGVYDKSTELDAFFARCRQLVG